MSIANRHPKIRNIILDNKTTNAKNFKKWTFVYFVPVIIALQREEYSTTEPDEKYFFQFVIESVIHEFSADQIYIYTYKHESNHAW
ncbi:MAG: hypothetical protein Satyrvirus19_1, partial [Satyrvirus sp.]